MRSRPASTSKRGENRSNVYPTRRARPRDVRTNYPRRKGAGSHPRVSLVIFSFGTREKFGDVVITETSAQAQGPGFGAIVLARCGLQDFLQPKTQRSLDNLLEGLAQSGRPFPGFGGDIRVECH